MITVAEARARGLALPSDDDAAQDVIDEQEAWLAARIGPLVGERTETFWVGLGVSDGKLSLTRRTDSVAVVDGGSPVDAAQIRLIDDGAAFRLRYPYGWRAWTGPFVEVTYTPNDELLVQRALYELLALAAPGAIGPFASETMGDYSYSRNTATGSSIGSAAKGAIVASILPRRPQLMTVHYATPVPPHGVRL